MSENSKIQWTDHTFNPWRGCAKVSPGCKHCYAETRAKRFGPVQGEWGPGARRVIAADATWKQPLYWNAKAKAAGVPARVFCASLADFLEDYRGGVVVNHNLKQIDTTLDPARRRLADLIRETPWLQWLLLTKRPENYGSLFPEAEDLPNILLGISAEDQEHYELRMRRVPTSEPYFISAEPLLGPVDLDPIISPPRAWSEVGHLPAWVIVGGESGAGARPMELKWALSLRDQCEDLEIPFFFKQWGGVNKHTPDNHLLEGREYTALPDLFSR